MRTSYSYSQYKPNKEYVKKVFVACHTPFTNSVLELLALLKLKGIGRVRARKMFNNKIKDIGDVKKADVKILKGILGEKIALDVKEQVSGVKEKPDKEQYEIKDYE